MTDEYRGEPITILSERGPVLHPSYPSVTPGGGQSTQVATSYTIQIVLPVSNDHNLDTQMSLCPKKSLAVKAPPRGWYVMIGVRELLPPVLREGGSVTCFLPPARIKGVGFSLPSEDVLSSVVVKLSGIPQMSHESVFCRSDPGYNDHASWQIIQFVICCYIYCRFYTSLCNSDRLSAIQYKQILTDIEGFSQLIYPVGSLAIILINKHTCTCDNYTNTINLDQWN